VDSQPSTSDPRIARIIDREIAPVWHDRFARLLWRHLPECSSPLVLDVHCGTGRTSAQILQRLPGARVVGLEPDASLLSLARARLQQWPDQVYLKGDDLSGVAEMPNAAYDLVIANLVLGDAADLQAALGELLRVTKPTGAVLATLPMRGTWAEAEDLFAEVLGDAGLERARERLERLRLLRPTGSELAQMLEELGVDRSRFAIEQDSYELLFPGGRDFLLTPVIEYGPVPVWKALAGHRADVHRLFWQLKQAIDTYFQGQVFGVTVVCGVLCADGPAAPTRSQSFWSQFQQLDSIWTRGAPQDPSVGEQDDYLDTRVPVPPPRRAASESLIGAVQRGRERDEEATELDAMIDEVLSYDPYDEPPPEEPR
jgi:SAM-dependent methyltransferase